MSTPPLRIRILDAARDITCDEGWGAVTMPRLAKTIGVSRQTVYTEVGSKDRLAEAMVMREFRAFLEVVDSQLTAGKDPIDSVRRAACAVMGLAASSPLLRAVIESAHGDNHGLLPLVTTNSQPMVAAATGMIELGLARLYPDLPLDERDLGIAVDSLVRLTLSQVLQPHAPLGQAVEEITWVAKRLLSSELPQARPILPGNRSADSAADASRTRAARTMSGSEVRHMGGKERSRSSP